MDLQPSARQKIWTMRANLVQIYLFHAEPGDGLLACRYNAGSEDEEVCRSGVRQVCESPEQPAISEMMKDLHFVAMYSFFLISGELPFISSPRMLSFFPSP